MNGPSCGRRGITLVGLLVVIAIVVVVGFLLRGLLGRALGGSVQAMCLNNLRKIGQALQTYANDSNDIVPPAQWSTGRGFVRWDECLGPLVSERERESIFQCPAKKSAKIGYAVNYKAFRDNPVSKVLKQNFVSSKQIRNPSETIYALDTGRVTDETKNLPPEQWQESPGDAPPICRCSSGDKNWGEDPVRPMPRHNGRVDCLMLDGAVKDYTVHEITLPKESSPLCLWDAN